MRLSHLAAALLISCTAALAAEPSQPTDATMPAATPAPPPTPAPSPPLNEAAKLPKPAEVIRFVPSEEESILALSAVANPDCSSVGKTFSRVITKPEHGDLIFIYKKIFTTFSARIYEHCNEVEVPGLETHYRSAPGFFGEDKAEVLYIYPNGNAQSVRFLIEVK